jgi:hypothetical protein
MPTLLLYLSETKKRWRVELEGEKFLIGRSREAEVPIAHASVSKKHVVIERRGGQYTFRDLGSRNGTYINELRASHGPLADGDELRVGAVEITFYRGEPPPLPLTGSFSRGAGAKGGEKGGPEAAGGARGGDARSARAPPAPPPALDAADSPVLDAADTMMFTAPPLAGAPRAPPPEAGVTGATQEASRSAATGSPPGARAPSVGTRRASGGFARAPGARAERAVPLETGAARGTARGWPSWALGAAALVSFALGLLLGYVAGSWERAAEPGAGPSRGTGHSRGEPAGRREVAVSQGTDGTTDGKVASPFASRAPLDDPVTSARHAVRLSLDLRGRPPTRAELEDLETKSHEERWILLEPGRAGDGEEGAAAWEDSRAGFRRLAAREPSPEEHEALLALSKGSPQHYVFLVAQSPFYASAEHRRRRSEEQLARSLVTDLTGRPPTREALEKAVAILKAEAGKRARLAEALVEIEGPGVGPREGEERAAWVRSVYARLLLRAPSEAEERAALERLETEGGWRDLLLDLIAREEYLEY